MKKLFKSAAILGLAFASLSACQPNGPAESSSSSSSSPAVTETYSNPLIAHDFADPYVYRADDGYFYAYATEGAVARSEDMVEWEDIDKLDTPTWGTPGAKLWAPCLAKFGDTYNLYYALSTWGDPNPGIGVMVADSPAGPFTDMGELFDSNSSGVRNSIDPDVFVDPATGKAYIIWGSFNGIWAWELNAETGLGMIGDPVCIITSTAYEAPNMLVKDGIYYLFMSAGSCCEGENSTYNVQVYTATSALGPYTKSPVGDASWSGSILHQLPPGTVTSGSGPVTAIYGPGHSCVVQDDAGDYWLYYHGFLRRGVVQSTRILFMDKLLWTEDGYPYIEGYVPNLDEQAAPVID